MAAEDERGEGEEIVEQVYGVGAWSFRDQSFVAHAA